ncbi:UPF0149 family protein [Halochromatium glycolicum]|nr:UPF0149 family protein [Halochromatium glycolicum]
MVSDPVPDYDRLDQLLAGVELAPSAAEAQAILCGLLAAHEPDPVGRWSTQLGTPPRAVVRWSQHLLGQAQPAEPPAGLSAGLSAELPGAQQASSLGQDGGAVETGAAAIDLTVAGQVGATGSGQGLDHEQDHGHLDAHAEAHGHACDTHHSHAPEPTETETETAIDGDALLAELATLARWTEEAIAPPSVSFNLLLPPEDRPLRERALAVHDWVRGLLFGLTLGGLEPEGLDGEAREAFSDLVELTRMDLAAIDEGEEDEQALAEITEFLRVAAMAIRESVSPAGADAVGAPTTQSGPGQEVH